MEPPERQTVDEILKKHAARIEQRIKTDTTSSVQNSDFSKNYKTFKEEMAPELSRYEKWCKSLGSFVKINPSMKDQEKINKDENIEDYFSNPNHGLIIANKS